MPTLYPMSDSLSGPLETVNGWVQDPLAIPQAVIELMDQDTIPEAVLRYGGLTRSGIVKYRETDPAYSQDSPQIRQEFDEPTIMRGARGQAYTVSTEELAGSVLVSEEMRRREILDPLNKQLTQATNSFKKTWGDRFRSTIFNHPRVQSYACPQHWDSTTAQTRNDILSAKRLIKTAYPDGTNQYSRFGYSPDTLIIGEDAEQSLLASDEYNKIYQGNIASENPQYKGTLDNKVFGLNVLVDTFMPPGKAIMMQSKIAGAYVDEVPFTVDPTHEWVDHYSWRTNFRRSSVCFLDAPKAVCVINGVS